MKIDGNNDGFEASPLKPSASTHVCVGAFRPTFEDVLTQIRAGTATRASGERYITSTYTSNESIRNEWQRGEFDTLVYRPIAEIDPSGNKDFGKADQIVRLDELVGKLFSRCTELSNRIFVLEAELRATLAIPQLKARRWWNLFR